MNSFLHQQRASGILAHITSLPGPFGIGDIGPSAYRFLDFLKAAGQRYWQILPTCPICALFDNSPYMSTSSRAGSPLLISPQLLYEHGLLDRRTFESAGDLSPYLVDYPKVEAFKKHLLHQAFSNFLSKKIPSRLASTSQTISSWLDDYALFMAIKEAHHGAPWFKWPKALARRSPKALSSARASHAKRIDYYHFEQHLFISQWSELKRYAKQNGIRIIGDIPIYVGLDSADVWTHRDIYELDESTLLPLRVSGVPPDYFSKTGQRWGNPLYRWNSKNPAIKKELFTWWRSRFESVFELVDVARIDHFRGFESYWAVPAEEETALNGTWESGPGAGFFRDIEAAIGRLDIIAEDLGIITPAVVKLREELGFPGMKVLQFAFDANGDNPFLPYNFTSPNCVVYTGTHDNDTTLGWFLSEVLSESDRQRIKRYANRQMHDNSPIHEDLLYLSLSSTAALAVTPLQDLLGFGSDCRMNIPGRPEGNWRWRCAEQFLTDNLAQWLRDLTNRFGR